MIRSWLASTALVCAAAAAVVSPAPLRAAGGQAKEAADPNAAIGTWKGTWQAASDGGGSGNIVLTFEKGKDGKLAGKISVSPQPAYDAVFKTVAVERNTVTAGYDAPDEPNIEIQITGTFEKAGGTGTWTARDKSSGNAVERGTWKAARN